MARTRQQSVPAPKRQPDDSNAVHSVVMMPHVSTTSKVQYVNGRVWPPTDALARMTMELNMRAMNSQAQRLEHDISLLVKATEKDQDFRDQNEDRLKAIWKEVAAVKAHVSQMEEGQDDASLRYERYRQETTASIEEFRKEMGDFQNMCSNLSTQLDSLPTMADLDLLATQPLPGDSHSSSTEVFHQQPPRSSQRQGQTKPRKFLFVRTSH